MYISSFEFMKYDAMYDLPWIYDVVWIEDIYMMWIVGLWIEYDVVIEMWCACVMKWERLLKCELKHIVNWMNVGEINVW